MIGTKRAEEMRQLICQLQGVVAAQVVLDEKGDLAEIHILSESERSPKQLVRDVESAIQAQLGVRVDHKKVSVAQVDRNKDVSILPRAPTRIELSKIDLSVSGLDCQARVSLSRNGTESCGAAAGYSSKESLLRLTASATSNAVKQFLGEACWLLVEDVVSLSLVKREVVLVLLVLVTPESSVELVGAAIVRRSLQEAAASATLNAINRYLAPSVRERSDSGPEEV